MIDVLKKKEEKRFLTLSEFEYDDLIILMSFLKDNSKETENSQKMLDAVKRIDSFFPEMEITEEIILQGICTTILDGRDGKADFERFKRNNPNIKIDREGRSVPDKKSYSGIRLSALDQLFEQAKSILQIKNFVDNSQNRINTQIYNGKTLKEFIEKPSDKVSFQVTKTIFLKKYKNFSKSEIDILEDFLIELCNSKELLRKLLSFGIKQKNLNHFLTLFHHIKNRIEIAFKEIKEGRKMSSSSEEFIKALKDASF